MSLLPFPIEPPPSLLRSVVFMTLTKKPLMRGVMGYDSTAAVNTPVAHHPQITDESRSVKKTEVIGAVADLNG